MEIVDLNKWNKQTLLYVERALEKGEAPCVGFCLLFMNHLGGEKVEWKYKPYLAFDPHNPPPPEDRKKLEEIFNRFGELAQAIMSGGTLDYDS